MIVNDFISIDHELPKKGKDIIGKDDDGNLHYCFLCACHNPKCTEWRDSLGYGLLVNIVEWKYVDDNDISDHYENDYTFDPFKDLDILL
jgi:hypothetical protein